MYGALWRHLPGPWPARLAVMLAGFAGVVVLLFDVVFPAVDPHLPWTHDTVSTSGSTPPAGDFETGPASVSARVPTTVPPVAGRSAPARTAPARTAPARSAPRSTSPSVLPGD